MPKKPTAQNPLDTEKPCHEAVDGESTAFQVALEECYLEALNRESTVLQVAQFEKRLSDFWHDFLARSDLELLEDAARELRRLAIELECEELRPSIHGGYLLRDTPSASFGFFLALGLAERDPKNRRRRRCSYLGAKDLIKAARAAYVSGDLKLRESGGKSYVRPCNLARWAIKSGALWYFDDPVAKDVRYFSMIFGMSSLPMPKYSQFLEPSPRTLDFLESLLKAVPAHCDGDADAPRRGRPKWKPKETKWAFDIWTEAQKACPEVGRLTYKRFYEDASPSGKREFKKHGFKSHVEFRQAVERHRRNNRD